MFETSVIQDQPRVATGRLSLLTVSIIAHSTVIIGAIVVSVATVRFPISAPDQFALAPTFVPLLLPPPPLGDPNGGAPRKPEPAKAATPAPPPPSNQNTAPSVVPDTVTQVATPATGDSNAIGNPNATSTAPIGQLWGTPGSVGDLNNPPAEVAAQPVPERIYEAHEVKAPVGLYRPAPPYPQILIRTKKQATVVVRCVIDKNGHVRDPQVIVPASLAPFNDAVIAAVQQWRFTPGSRNGVAVETYLSLTVNFSVQRQ